MAPVKFLIPDFNEENQFFHIRGMENYVTLLNKRFQTHKRGILFMKYGTEKCRLKCKALARSTVSRSHSTDMEKKYSYPESLSPSCAVKIKLVAPF